MSTARCAVVPIFPSPRAISVYTINDRVYTVYTTGVYFGRNEIASFKSRIVDSTLCGKALALFFSDSTLAVLSPRTLEDEHYWGSHAEIAEESTGVSHFHEILPKGSQMISADYAGSLICVHLGFSTVAIYEYSSTSHTLHSLKSTIIEHDFTKFQIVSVGSLPYLWTVRLDREMGYAIELHEIASVAFKHTAGREICSLPLNIPLEALTEPNVELISAGGRDGSLLIYAAHRLFYITLGSAVAGDTLPTIHPGIDSASAFFYTQKSSKSRTFYVTDTDGAVFELVIESQEKRIGQSSKAVSEVPEFALPDQEKWFLALPVNSKVICVPRGGTRITQCELDTRRWPWRTLVLSGSHLTALAPITAINYTERSGIDCLNSVLMMAQVPRLKTLFVSTATGTGWLASKEVSFDGLKEKTLLAAGIMSNYLVFIFANRVELRSTLAPHRLMSSWDSAPNDLVLDASIGSKYSLLRMPEKVVALRLNGQSLETLEVFSGLTVTFVRCDEEKSYIGVAAMSETEQYDLKQRFASKVATDSSSVAGATFCFDDNLDHPIGLQFHRYLPTDLVALRGGTLVVLYSVDGRVALFPKNAEAPTIYNVLSTVYVAGRLGQYRQAAILYGRGGLWAATNEGCRMICDRRSRKLGDIIQRACVLEDGNIAFVAKGELRFLQSPLSYGNQLPSQLQSVSNLAKNTRILLIPSKRIILVHGGSVCTFMDSVSFEPLLVSGLRAQCCDEVSLWQFEVDGESYEHLLFSNGKAVIESYAIHRDHNEVTLNCKLRFLVSRENDMTPRRREVLHCYGQYVYLGRHDYLLKASPMENRRFGPVYFDSEVRFVSQVQNYLVVSTEKTVNILDAAELRKLASATIGKGNAGHAAGFVNIDEQRLLHILCAREKERFTVFVFDDKKNTLRMETPRLDGLSERDHRIRSLSRLSNRSSENGFSVMAVMADYSIKHIAITSPAIAPELVAVDTI